LPMLRAGTLSEMIDLRAKFAEIGSKSWGCQKGKPKRDEGLRVASGVHDGQGSVEDREADDFGFGDVRSVRDAAWRKEKGAGLIGHAGFLPFARQDVNEFIRVGMNVRRDGHASVKFPEHGDAAGLFVLVERH